MNPLHDASIWLAGKTLTELGFPDDWEYDPAMCRWRSEKHVAWVRTGQSRKLTGKDWGEPWKAYLYITDKMLCEMGWRLRRKED